MNPDQPWMCGPWGGMCLFPMVMFIVMLAFLVLFCGRWGCSLPWRRPDMLHRGIADLETPLEILKRRYAKGEISKDEFDRMKKDVMG